MHWIQRRDAFWSDLSEISMFGYTESQKEKIKRKEQRNEERERGRVKTVMPA